MTIACQAGTAPAFPGSGGTIPVYRPRLPTADKLMPYLLNIDSNRWYSNRGPLTCLLEQRVRRMLGGAAVAATASGQAALEAAILASAGRARPQRPLALMPSYTFAATAAAAERCGYQPYFVDVDEASWLIDPEGLAGHRVLGSTGLVIPVSAYGRGVAQAPWLEFRERTGIPVVVDAAAAFEDLLRRPRELIGPIPAAISLQATKVFSAGEGGLVAATDERVALGVVQATNFGFFGSREALRPGFNGKMSEYHAAVALAFLDEWDGRGAEWRAMQAIYRDLAAGAGLSRHLVLAPSVASCYALFHAPAAVSERVMRTFGERGMEYRFWYGHGLHRHRHFSNAPRDSLKVTSRISRRILGIPTAIDLPEASISRVVAALSDAVAVL